MALTTLITARTKADHVSALDLGNATLALDVTATHDLASGTGADQADIAFSDRRTLTASATENLDLAGGLTDAFGATLTFARVKAIMVKASSSNTNDVVLGGAASNAFVNWVGDATDTVKVKPGGSFLIVAPNATGYVVTAGTGDILKVANSAGSTSVVYDIIIIGASA